MKLRLTRLVELRPDHRIRFDGEDTAWENIPHDARIAAHAMAQARRAHPLAHDFLEQHPHP